MSAKRRPVSALVYIARRHGDEWQFLLLRRVPEAGGFWQGVTGALEDGESPLDAATREMREETGLSIATIPVPFVHRFSVTSAEWDGTADDPASHVHIVEYTFLAVADGSDEPRLSGEHDLHRWCRLEEAIGLLRFEGNVMALRACAAALPGK